MKLNSYTRTMAATAFSALMLAGVMATSAEARSAHRWGGPVVARGYYGGWAGPHAGWGYNRGWNRGWNNGWGWGAAGLFGGLALGAMATSNWDNAGYYGGYGGNVGYYGAAWNSPTYYPGGYWRRCICR